ncbi:hypothetical protein DBV05_g313 [Lasiodiplodia theobromae]|uniref:Uncharacterized protein n=1 Tax=Lasiodiplodia theobromae TaxID=45133 RepID=A0A5N5DTH9_9PEZI|nr:hypothetical protein DBV05_g313 [Lasiodiplodia theobromae]
MADPNNDHPHVDPNANSPIARLYRLLNGPGFSCSGIRAPLIFASGDDTAAPAAGSSPTNNNNGSSASNNDGSGEARLRGGGSDTEDEEKNKEDRSEYLEPNPHENSLFMNLVELLKELELQKENDHARNHPDKTITHRDATRGGASLPNDVTSALEDLLEHLLEDVQPHAKSPARTPQGPLDSKGDNNTNNDDAPPAYEPASRLRGGGNWLSREQAGGARPCHSQQQSPSPPPSPPSSPSSHHRPPFPAVAAHESAQDSKEGASKPRSLNPQQQHSTIVPLRNFPLPVPAVLKDSLVVQLPRSFCRQVHGRVRMAVDAWAAAEGSGARAWSSSPEPPSLRPLWSECFGEMSPREVAEHGRDYECRKGAGAGSRFQGPYWVKDREGRVRAVEREGERRELGRRWFGEEEEETVEEKKKKKKKKKKSEGGWGDGDEVVTGRLRGGGDDDDDDDGEGYDSDLHKWVRDDHNDWRIFTTSKLPRPADDYPPKSLIPRWFRRRPHRTIVPMPDFVLKPRFIGDRRNYMDFIFGPRKLGIGHSLEPPKLEITETSEPWEKVFTSWSPRELADLQRGWEEYQYGRYDGPYWNCDEQGNVRVVETKQAREELMEEWFGKDEGKGEGKDEGKDKGKAKWLVGKARLRGGGRFDDEADDSGSDLWEYRRRNQDNDGFVPLGSDGSSVRSTRGSSSSEEPAEVFGTKKIRKSSSNINIKHPVPLSVKWDIPAKSVESL